MTGDQMSVRAHRDIAVPVEQLQSVIRDPDLYPSWIEGLVRFAPSDAGSYVGEVGYLGRRRERQVRQVSAEPGGIAWETCDPDTERSRIRWEVRVSPSGSDGGRVHFVWEKWGSGSVFGPRASNLLFKAALEVVAERSLERLEALALEKAARASARG